MTKKAVHVMKGVLAASLLAALPTRAQGELVTFEVTASVTAFANASDAFKAEFPVGTPMTFTWTFESTAPDLSPSNSHFGFYYFDPTPEDYLTLTIGTYSVSAPRGRIIIRDDFALPWA